MLAFIRVKENKKSGCDRDMILQELQGNLWRIGSDRLQEIIPVRTVLRSSYIIDNKGI